MKPGLTFFLASVIACLFGPPVLSLRLLQATKTLIHQVRHRQIIRDDDIGGIDQADDYFMNRAMQQAKRAQSKGEVPVGAVVVTSHRIPSSEDGENCDSFYYRVLGKGGNRVETRKDASAHAELLALRSAARTVGNWRLGSRTFVDLDTTTTLYSTLEPCPMCLAAALAFRIDRIVYGAPDLRIGAVETHMHMLRDYQHPYHNITQVVAGVRQNESSQLLLDFFRSRRKENRKKITRK